MKFLDIGANVGNYSLEAISKGYDVIAVEANPNLISELQKNIPGHIVINKAVSNVDNETIILHLHTQHELSTVNKLWRGVGRFSWRGVYANLGLWQGTEEVETITIESLIQEYGIPDLIKVDVEEHEWEAISSLKTKSKELCFEWHKEGAESVKLIIQHLKEIGYSEYGLYICEEGNEEYFKRPKKYTTDHMSVYEEINNLQKLNYDWGMVWCK